jgi:hypothetical protein
LQRGSNDWADFFELIIESAQFALKVAFQLGSVTVAQTPREQIRENGQHNQTLFQYFPVKIDIKHDF